MASSSYDVTTAEQLLNTSIEEPCELIRGELRILPYNDMAHGSTAARINVSLSTQVQSLRLGRVHIVLGCILQRNPDTVRAPDVSFISRDRLKLFESRYSYFPAAPDLAVEVVSVFDTREYVDQKASDWIAAGSQMVLVANPRTFTIEVYQPHHEILRFGRQDEIDASAAVHGWKLSVEDAFGWVDYLS